MKRTQNFVTNHRRGRKAPTKSVAMGWGIFLKATCQLCLGVCGCVSFFGLGGWVGQNQGQGWMNERVCTRGRLVTQEGGGSTFWGLLGRAGSGTCPLVNLETLGHNPTGLTGPVATSRTYRTRYGRSPLHFGLLHQCLACLWHWPPQRPISMAQENWAASRVWATVWAKPLGVF